MAARARLRRGAINRAVSTRLDLAKLKGNLAGGATSAILTVRLYSAIFIPLTILLLGDRHPLMYSPRSVVTFLLASVIAGDLAQARGPRTLVLVFLVIFLAGIFQALFGILRLLAHAHTSNVESGSY